MTAQDRDPPRPTASARIAAMESMIRASLESMTAGARPRSASESLLFLGNWHDTNPRLLICDPVLEPVDKIVYQVIRQDVSPQHGTSFPTYQQIATAANIASDATVARAIAILRVTRWLTLCAKARDIRGRFRGSVYALHDEPLALPDTLALDPEYMAFLHQMRAHKHARVRDIANAFLTSLDADIQAGHDITAPTDALQLRQESSQFVAQLRQGLDIRALRFNGFAGDLVGGLMNRPAADPQDPPLGDTDRLQNLKSVESGLLQNLKTESQQQNLRPQNLRPQNLPPQNLPTPCSSSSFIKTTTTTTSAHARASGAESSPLSDLVCPQNLLSANERHLAHMHLRRVRPQRRQAILDVLIHRLQSGELRSPIGYLLTLVEREQTGALADLRPLPAADSAAAGDSSPRDEVAERVARLHQEIHSIRSFIQRLKGLGNNPSMQQQNDHRERLEREEQRLSVAVTEIRGLLQQRPDLLAAGADARADESRQ